MDRFQRSDAMQYDFTRGGAPFVAPSHPVNIPVKQTSLQLPDTTTEQVDRDENVENEASIGGGAESGAKTMEEAKSECEGEGCGGSDTIPADAAGDDAPADASGTATSVLAASSPVAAAATPYVPLADLSYSTMRKVFIPDLLIVMLAFLGVDDVGAFTCLCACMCVRVYVC